MRQKYKISIDVWPIQTVGVGGREGKRNGPMKGAVGEGRGRERMFFAEVRAMMDANSMVAAAAMTHLAASRTVLQLF